MSNTRQAQAWHSNYEVRLSPEAPGDGREIVEFRATSNTGGRMLLIEIMRDGASWFARFECGDGQMTRVVATPAADDVCVIASGQGYWVSTRDRGKFELVATYPVREVHAIYDPALLVFADYTDVSAYGERGRVWGSGRISTDGISITRADSIVIEGLAWDAAEGRDVRFSIDPASGKVDRQVVSE